MIPINVLRTFKITGRTSMKKSLFKIIKGISAFCISADTISRGYLYSEKKLS